MPEKKILIVDDDRDMAALIKFSLTAADRAFTVAFDGVGAVEKAFTEAPDLILLDVMMPKMNGYQVCRLLKNDRSTWHIPIIMLTAKDRDKDRFYGMSAGADDFIVKPFHQDELKEKVDSLLAKSATAGKACPIEARVRADEASLLSKVNSLLDKKLQEMTFLQYMIKALVSTFDEDRILGTVIGGITTYLGYRHVVIFMHDASGAMREAVSEGYPRDGAKRTFDPGDNETLSRLFHSKEPVILPGRMLDLSSGMPAQKGQDTVRQQALIPIIRREEVFGVLVVEGWMDEPPFSEERVGVLTTLAGQLGLALDNAHLYRSTLHLSITDGLTGLFNARYFYKRLDVEISRARRYKHDLSLFMMDIDFFKGFNDKYGHLCGDDALKHIAAILKQNSRETDTVARYGGEEFCVVLPETGAENAAVLAERIRRSVEDTPVDPGCDSPPARLTISIGIVTLPAGLSSAEELVRLADKALYRAKEDGRNRVCVHAPTQP